MWDCTFCIPNIIIFCEYHGIIHVKITIRKHFQNVYNTSVLHGMTSISLEYTFERNSQDYACE